MVLTFHALLGNREKELRSDPPTSLHCVSSSHPLSIPPKPLSIQVRVGEGQGEQGRGNKRRRRKKGVGWERKGGEITGMMGTGHTVPGRLRSHSHGRVGLEVLSGPFNSSCLSPFPEVTPTPSLQDRCPRKRDPERHTQARQLECGANI